MEELKKNQGTSTQQTIQNPTRCQQVTERARRVWAPGANSPGGELGVLFKHRGRASYPAWMGEKSEKASWRQQHHLRDEEASINTKDKQKVGRQAAETPDKGSDPNPRPAPATTGI